jgi:hypothetical protein
MKRILIFITLVIVSSVSAAQDITGDWQGTIRTGMGELRLVLHVAKNPDGIFKALIDSPDQGAPGVPIDSITFEGNKLRFTSAPLKATYEGTLKGTDFIKGDWTQGSKLPLDFKKTTSPVKTQHKPAPPSDIDGKWEGVLDVPPSMLHIIFHLQNTEDGLIAIMDSPDQKLKGWPATSLTRKNSSIKIEMKQISGFYEGKINKQLDTISGDWNQGESSIALVLKHAKDDPGNAPR